MNSVVKEKKKTVSWTKLPPFISNNTFITWHFCPPDSQMAILALNMGRLCRLASELLMLLENDGEEWSLTSVALYSCFKQARIVSYT